MTFDDLGLKTAFERLLDNLNEAAIYSKTSGELLHEPLYRYQSAKKYLFFRLTIRPAINDF